MKKLITLSLALASVYSMFAQDSTLTKSKKKDWSKVSLANRPNDHFMIQIGYNGWASRPDTISTKSIPRSFNFYFMFDLPFKTDPRFSVGVGVGLGTDNFYLNKQTVDIAGKNTSTLSFRKNSDSTYYKRYKIATTYLEAPVELRFCANPLNSNKSFKAAIGGKIGTLLSAESKGRILLNSSGSTLNTLTVKEKSKRFFNGTRLAVGARISKGVFGVYGQYQINNFIRDGGGPTEIHPFQIGFTISGL